LFDDDDDAMVVPVDPDLVALDADIDPIPEVFDQYISANILVERQGETMRGK
jgi:hypothetical protein